MEFVDVNESELEKAMDQAKARYVEVEAEISQWMTQKAEPNLVEVERKSCKYKIKWESMKIYDQRLKLRAYASRRKLLQSQ